MWPQTSWKLKWKFKTNGLSRFLPYETQCCWVKSIYYHWLFSENAKIESYGYCDNLATLMFHNKDAVYSIWGQKNKCYSNLFHFHNSTVTNSFYISCNLSHKRKVGAEYPEGKSYLMPKSFIIKLKSTLFLVWFFSAKLTTSSKIQPNVRRKSTTRKNGFWQWFRHRSEQKFEKAMGGILPFLLPNLSTRCVFIWYHIFRIFHWRFCDSHFTIIPWFLDSEEHFRKNYGEQKSSYVWWKCLKQFHLF